MTKDDDDFGTLEVDKEILIKCDDIDVIVKMSTKFLDVLTKHYNLESNTQVTNTHVNDFVVDVLKKQLELINVERE